MSKIILKNVRLSFPSLFSYATYKGTSLDKYSATFMLSKKDVETKSKLDAMIKELITEHKVKSKINSDKLFLKDGDESNREEYAGHWTIKASTKKRPTIINRDKSPITEEDNIIYGGCYVNAIISIWFCDKSGNGIYANLHGIQFVKDGESFGSDTVNVTDSFDVIADDLPAGEDLAF
jgi:hypothetical protein